MALAFDTSSFFAALGASSLVALALGAWFNYLLQKQQQEFQRELKRNEPRQNFISEKQHEAINELLSNQKRLHHEISEVDFSINQALRNNIGQLPEIADGASALHTEIVTLLRAFSVEMHLLPADIGIAGFKAFSALAVVVIKQSTVLLNPPSKENIAARLESNRKGMQEYSAAYSKLLVILSQWGV